MRWVWSTPWRQGSYPHKGGSETQRVDDGEHRGFVVNTCEPAGFATLEKGKETCGRNRTFNGMNRGGVAIPGRETQYLGQRHFFSKSEEKKSGASYSKKVKGRSLNAVRREVRGYGRSLRGDGKLSGTR